MAPSKGEQIFLSPITSAPYRGILFLGGALIEANMVHDMRCKWNLDHNKCTVCVCVCALTHQPPFEVRCPCWFAVQPMSVGAGVHDSCTVAPSEGELVQCGIWGGPQWGEGYSEAAT